MYEYLAGFSSIVFMQMLKNFESVQICSNVNIALISLF